MRVASRLRHRISGWAARRLARRPIECQPQRPLVSFTFDDFPRTAWQAGGEILNRRSVPATYFVALGLAGQTGVGGPLFDLDDISAVVESGHELGCHTYSHDIGENVAAEAYRSSIDRNRRAVQQLLTGYTLKTFAYPRGSATVAAKRIVGERFVCGRGIQPGINYGRVDANLLLANSLYSRHYALDDRRSLIAENVRRSGWLIFYTHDVQNEPSRFGCTPDYFAAIVDAVLQSGCETVTVAEAMQRIARGPDQVQSRTTNRAVES